MSGRGHEVFVFCSTVKETTEGQEQPVKVYRCKAKTPGDFSDAVLPIFSEAHKKHRFNIVEVPEIHANGLLIRKAFPALPMIVRLHMASFIQQELMRAYFSRWSAFRFWFGNFRKGRWKTLSSYNFRKDPEYIFTNLADAISAPSEAQKSQTHKAWKIHSNRITVIPNPFEPEQAYLEIPVEKKTADQVCFIGKLNTHKGIVALTRAIPLVLEDHPETAFILIGDDCYFSAKQMMMSEYIKTELGEQFNKVWLVGGIAHDLLPEYLKNAAVCVFPSLWECFGIVCLEAMSAGRMVIGSRNGGMNEILSAGAGVTVDPENSKALAQEISKALSDENLRFSFGRKGREKAIHQYAGAVVGEAMESFYSDVLVRHATNN